MIENYYDILGLIPSATPAEIKRAYAQKIRQYSNESHPEQFQLIRKAYEVLSKAKERADYDKRLRSGNRHESQLNQAQSYMKQGDYAQARILLDGLEKEDPNDDSVLFLLGALYDLQELHSEALPYWERLKSLYPDDPVYAVRLCRTCFQLERIRESIQSLTTYIERKKELDLQDLDVLVDLFFIGYYVQEDELFQMAERQIKKLASSNRNRESVLVVLVGTLEEFELSHPFNQPLLQLINDLNLYDDPEVIAFVETRTAQIQSAPSAASIGGYSSGHTVAASATEGEEERPKRSILLAIIIGIIMSIIATPIVGIIAGFVAYFYSEQIKTILSCLGCLVIVILVIGAIVISNL